MITYNKNDQHLWNTIFDRPKAEWIANWKSLPKTKYREDCIIFFKRENVISVLDLGCGSGSWAVQFALNGFEVTATDFSETAITFAKNFAKEQKLKINFVVAPITQKILNNDLVDGISASLILDNVSFEEMLAAIEIQKQQLRPNGVMFALFNPFMTKQQCKKMMDNADNPTRDITSVMYKDDELKQIFKGFSLIDFKIYEHGLRGIFLKKN